MFMKMNGYGVMLMVVPNLQYEGVMEVLKKERKWLRSHCVVIVM
jgi:hypothetical protein